MRRRWILGRAILTATVLLAAAVWSLGEALGAAGA
jgi:hypothetical protein